MTKEQKMQAVELAKDIASDARCLRDDIKTGNGTAYIGFIKDKLMKLQYLVR